MPFLGMGRYPTISLADAHAAARNAKLVVKAGIDPREQTRQQQVDVADARRLTFSVVANQFMERYACTRLRPRTIEAYTSALTGPQIKGWQDKPVSGISRGHVMELINGLESEGKHASARLQLAYLSKFFSWCAERDLVSDVPTDRIRLNGTVKTRERSLNIEELRRVGSSAGRVGGIGGALVKLLMLTGQRRHETSVMRWHDLSGLETDEALWSIPGDMTKNHRPHTVPLVPETVCIIRALPVIEGSELVFTTTGKTPFSGFSKLKRQIDQAIAEDGGEPMPAWTMHDLRRSLVSQRQCLLMPVICPLSEAKWP